MEGVDRGGKLVTAPRKFAVASEAESDECIPAARRRPRPRTRAWFSGRTRWPDVRQAVRHAGTWPYGFSCCCYFGHLLRKRALAGLAHRRTTAAHAGRYSSRGPTARACPAEPGTVHPQERAVWPRIVRTMASNGSEAGPATLQILVLEDSTPDE
jgi:hypothetical protein